MGTLDLVGGASMGGVDASDLIAFAALLGTGCDYYSGTGAKYNPVADFNRDGFIDASDLALFTQHFGHGCDDWEQDPSKATTDAYPYYIFELPLMQHAMEVAGVDREFIVSVWERNGPEQRLFFKGQQYDRAQHWKSAARTSKHTSASTWSQVRHVYR
jgi:hypothetical protein